MVSAEAVIDEDLASEMIAEEVGADLFLMATDVDGAESMDPTAEAAARFAARTGKRAAIGSLASGVRVTAGAQAGEATPRTTWSPPSGVPRRLAGAG